MPTMFHFLLFNFLSHFQTSCDISRQVPVRQILKKVLIITQVKYMWNILVNTKITCDVFVDIISFLIFIVLLASFRKIQLCEQQQLTSWAIHEEILMGKNPEAKRRHSILTQRRDEKCCKGESLLLVQLIGFMIDRKHSAGLPMQACLGSSTEKSQTGLKGELN